MERSHPEGGFSHDRANGSFRRWRGRGGSGRGNKRREATKKVSEDDDRERERPPPGLRGKEIGLWHARRSQARKQQQELLNRPTIAIDSSQQSNIRRLLNNIAEVDNVPPEVLCDFDNVSEKKSDWEWKEEKASGLRPISGLSTPSWSESENVVDSWENMLDTEDQDSLKDNCSNRNGQASSKSSSQIDFTLSHSQKGSLQTASDVAQPGSSQQHQPTYFNSCLPGGGAAMCGNDEREKLLQVPQVSELLEYNRAHGDLIYLDQAIDLEMKQDQEEMRLERNPALDEYLKKEAAERLLNRNFQKMLDFRKKLPTYIMRQELLQLIRGNQVLVVSGETGCGKTTQVPQFVLDDFIERDMGSLCHIICTQPRRISAVSVAERVASERCEKCVGDGSSVGYQIRLEVRQPRKQGSLLFCTTGIVLKFLEKDPLLMRATHIILDEIHERDLQSDFLMIILKDILPKRPDLKIVLMSATLNANMFSKYFNNCPMVNIPGFTFPVKEFLLEDVLQMTGYQPDSSIQRKPKQRSKRKTSEREDEEEWNFQAWLRNLDKKYSSTTLKALSNFDYSRIDLDLVVTLLHHIIHRMEDGAILVFVPGWQEISTLHKMLGANSAFASGCRVIPLHSLMPTVNQREVFDRPPPGIRKIIIATNIAETSITIDDVVFVVDCGKIKVKDYNPNTNLTSLEPQLVSRANARQRRGRAGRVQAGYCYHLFTSLQLLEMRDYLPPEMLRTRLEELCLQIKLLKLGRIEPFVRKAMQPPSMEALHRAIVTLKELNALDSEENLLPLGVHLARMPVDPHTGKMILFGAMFCCLDPILTVAASLSFKDAFFIPLGKEKEADAARKELSQGSNSDHIVLINAMKGWERSVSQGSDRQFCWDYFMSSSTLKMLRDMKKQLTELLFDLNFVASKDPKDLQANIHSEDLGLVKAVLCAGLYPHVARVVKAPRPGDPPYKTVGVHLKNSKGKVGIHPKSVNCRGSCFPSKWLVYYHILKTTQVYIHDCTMVSPYPLLFFGGSINIIMDNGQECISVDDWIVFNASQSTAQLVLDLRQELDKLLAEKIVRPGVTCWKQTEKEGALMHSIAELISAEEVEGCVGVEKESRQGGSGPWQGGWKGRSKYSYRK